MVGKFLVLCMRTDIFAVSEFTNYNFNSMCEFNGVLLGANESGIFSHDADKDVSKLIKWSFSLYSSDWGIPKKKKVRLIYIGGVINDDITVEAIPVGGVTSSRKAELESISRRHKATVNFESVGQYWSVRISNDNGSNCTIDSIDAVVMPLSY